MDIKKIIIAVFTVTLLITAIAAADRNYKYVLTVGMKVNSPNYDPNTNYTTINAAIVAMDNMSSPTLSANNLGCIKIYPGTYVEELDDNSGGNDIPANCDLIGMGDSITQVTIRTGTAGKGKISIDCRGNNLLSNFYLKNVEDAKHPYWKRGIYFRGDGTIDNCKINVVHGVAVRASGHLIVRGSSTVIETMFTACIGVSSSFEIRDCTLKPKLRSWSAQNPMGIAIYGKGGGVIDNVTITSPSPHHHTSYSSQFNVKGIWVKAYNTDYLVEITNTTINLNYKYKYYPGEKATLSGNIIGIEVDRGYVHVNNCNINTTAKENVNLADPNDKGGAVKVIGIKVINGSTVELWGNSSISTGRTTVTSPDKGYQYLLVNGNLDKRSDKTGDLRIDRDTVTFSTSGDNNSNTYDTDYVYGTVVKLLRAKNITRNINYFYIQNAIDGANDGDIIVVGKGKHFETINFSGKKITLMSTDPNNWHVVADTVINGNNGTNVVIFNSSEDANSILSGLTIKNGVTNGIYCFRTSPVITNCIIDDGGKYGIYSNAGGSTKIKNNIIKNNTCGIMCSDTSPNITNNLIHHNTKAISMDTSSATITNNTIVNNTTHGIHNTKNSSPTITNCIIWNNGDDLSGLSATYSCIKNGGSGKGNISSDPYFVDTANDDYHILSNSPCIDVGDSSGSYTGQTDIDGDNRVIDVTGKGDGTVDVDMGSDEYNPS